MSDAWRNELATEKQKEKLRFFGCTWDEGVTAGQASDALEECARQFPDAEVAYQKSQPATEEQKDKLRFFGCTWNGDITVGQASDALAECSKQFPDREAGWQFQKKKWHIIPVTVRRARTIKTAIIPRTPPTTFERPDEAFPQEVTIQEAGKLRDVSPREYIIPARDVQYYAQRRPAIQKPAAYKITTPIERFTEWVDAQTERFTKWVDGILQRNQTCLGDHWLPAGPLSYGFASDDAITIGLSRQIADTIESKGYCVEPDARFGSGTYDRDQTLALFKPFDGDPIHPSTAYLGAANLLRLCILITTADGQIDLVELDVFRQAIENQIGLTQTDHKRLLILEQLLAQELCSASKTVAKIAKSVPADKRLVIGHLLVQVAAANNFITNEERRVLERIFKAFAIPPDTLEKLINQICPWPCRDTVQDDVSKRDKWLWNHWRSGHPGVVIDDFTLAEKKWNFNDWKALNARWRDLHERLAALQKHCGTASGASGEQISRPIAAPAPKAFALDMERVYQITNETKEVVAILSVWMEDEPEESIAMPASITLPAPEIPKVSSDGKAAPQSARFNGLNAAFHPVLDRLLTRDSWPLPDFNALANEFNFMPLNIRDTLNEWADEALGEFLLDGDDPIVICRELMLKERI